MTRSYEAEVNSNFESRECSFTSSRATASFTYILILILIMYYSGSNLNLHSDFDDFEAI
jgi:hypothetical protein